MEKHCEMEKSCVLGVSGSDGVLCDVRGLIDSPLCSSFCKFLKN